MPAGLGALWFWAESCNEAVAMIPENKIIAGQNGFTVKGSSLNSSALICIKKTAFEKRSAGGADIAFYVGAL